MPDFPMQMKAVVAEPAGGPEALKLKDFPVPEPGPGEVLVKVAAAGVNRPDLLQRQGKYNPPAGVTSILGLEMAGRVVACGDGVRGFRVGDKVCALLAGGGYAEYAVAPEGQCLHWPDGFPAAEAACLPEAVFTVWANLFEDGALKAGESVLVHGGASGIGTTAIQMARAAGADVLVTVGADEKAAACLKMGAALAINYRNEDFVKAILTHTAQRGVDVVLDMVGGDYLPRNLACLAPLGRHISIATQGGADANLNLRLVMARRLRLSGSTLRPRSVAEKTRLRDSLAPHIKNWIAGGKLKPQVFQCFPLEKVAEAHKLMESAAHIGKIALTLEA